jgi:methionine sulfoxide reductase heme-binding subunit
MIARLNEFLRRVPVWAVYVALALPAPYYVYLGATGGLGAEPIRALELELGGQALMLLIVGLAITPVRRYLGLNLIRFRRALGLLAFYYVALHLLVWLVLDVQLVDQIWADILKRPFVTIGMSAFALMIPLAVTSNNWSVRRLGPKWRRLHKLVYPVALLGGIHYMILVKGFPLEPLIYLGVIGGLLLSRWQRPPKFRLRTG